MSAHVPVPVLDVRGTPPIPFWRLVAVELRKAVDTLAGFWLLAAIAILVVLVDGFILLATLIQDLDVAFADFSQVTALVTSILLPVLGILLVTSEWSQRTAMVTFALEPRRLRVVLAKLAVGIVLTLATVVAAIAVGLVGTAICSALSSGETTWDIEATELVGFFLLQSLAMAGGFALATLLLNTPAAIVLFFVYQYVLPFVLLVISGIVPSFAEVSPYLNFVEAQGPLGDLSVSGEQWAQLIVSSIIWLWLPLGLGLARILRAEVK